MFVLTFQIDGESKEQLTLYETIDKSQNLASRLLQLNGLEGSIVGIISENRIQYLPTVLGSSLAGMVVTCLNPAYTNRKQNYLSLAFK